MELYSSQYLRELPVPWKYVDAPTVGGLRQVGFAPQSDLLLVISGSGAGVFNCRTGERVARDYDYELSFTQEVRLLATGIGLIEGISLRMAGLHGGGLPHMTEDGWGLEMEAPNWPEQDVYLTQPWELGQKQRRVKVAGDGSCELRAYGFSETGCSFVIATSCDVTFFTRRG